MILMLHFVKDAELSLEVIEFTFSKIYATVILQSSFHHHNLIYVGKTSE